MTTCGHEVGGKPWKPHLGIKFRSTPGHTDNLSKWQPSSAHRSSSLLVNSWVEIKVLFRNKKRTKLAENHQISRSFGSKYGMISPIQQLKHRRSWASTIRDIWRSGSFGLSGSSLSAGFEGIDAGTKTADLIHTSIKAQNCMEDAHFSIFHVRLTPQAATIMTVCCMKLPQDYKHAYSDASTVDS